MKLTESSYTPSQAIGIDLYWKYPRKYSSCIMSYSFNPESGLIIVFSEIVGPSGSIVLRLALDTGATGTMNVAPLITIGYDPSLAPDRVQVTTGSGVEYAPRFLISQFKALGQERYQFPVLAHTLPPSANIDGLLGLDFPREQDLYISFQRGSISLE
ncbi:retropepsin-like domain-containing protein [candidate division KSB1 bacterium]|nr:retropepsin-like domain-containing protein [candidate division KSB1 bacterium]